MSLRRLLWSFLALSTLAPGAALGGALVETRPILASGDEIAGAGRVGLFGFNIVGVDPAGRLIFGGYISDGSTGLFRTEGRSVIETIWTDPPSPPEARLDPLSARSSPNGLLVLESRPNPGSANPYAALYLLAGGEPELVARGGVFDVDGRFNCSVSLSGPNPVNDAGSVAFWRESAVIQEDCDETEDRPRRVETALYLGGRHALRRIIGPGDPFPGGGRIATPLRLLGIAADDALLVQAWPEDAAMGSAILAVRDGQTVILLADGDPGPQSALDDIDGLAANAAGDVLFLGSENGVRGLYRTSGGDVRLVTALTGRTPEGDVWPADSIVNGHATINARGDVAIDTNWVEPLGEDGARQVSGVLVYRADGGVDTIRDADSSALNDAGTLFYALLHFGFPIAAAKHTSSGAQIVLRNGDAAPGGGFFGVQGLEGTKCIAPNGTVAGSVFVGDGRQVLACGGEDGFAALAGDGDATSAGETINFIDECRWAGDDEIVFRASVSHPSTPGVSQTALLRVSSSGVTRVLGSADEGLEHIGAEFAVNAHGTVVVRMDREFPQPPGFLLSRRDGSTVTLTARPIVDRIRDFGVLDDDTVVAVADVIQSTGNTGIRFPSIVSFFATANGPATQVVTAPADPRLPGHPYGGFGDLFAAGSLVAVGALSTADLSPRFLRFALGEAFAPSDLLPPQSQATEVDVLDFTPGGRALFLASSASGRGYYLTDGESTQHLLDDVPFSPAVLAANDRGNVLFLSYGTATTYTQALSISGPEIPRQCSLAPAVEPTPAPKANGGCQLGDESAPTWLPLVFAILLSIVAHVHRSVCAHGPAPRGQAGAERGPPTCTHDTRQTRRAPLRGGQAARSAAPIELDSPIAIS